MSQTHIPTRGGIPPVTWAAAAEYLRCISHPHRLRMIEMLLTGRYTVGELAEACGIPSHMASEHLRLMRLCGLLVAERDGRRTFYLVADPELEGLMALIRQWFEPDSQAKVGDCGRRESARRRDRGCPGRRRVP